METLSDKRISDIEEQIEQEKKSVSFDMRELTIEIYVSKYMQDLEKDDNELYVPEYQREFVWDDKHQSRYIESLLLGLPVPFIFAAEIKKTGRLEIVDGSQRIRTMAAYLSDELKLKSLENLSELNNTFFSQLPSSRQRLFKNTALRMVVLSADATEEVRKEMFDRINTSSVPLLPMETRRGIYRGDFMNFITELANNNKFRQLCPLTIYSENRREEEELLLRFFAFSDCYPSYSAVEKNGVAKFLDLYVKDMNEKFSKEDRNHKQEAFDKLCDFISKTYPQQGFAKKKDTRGISKPYFEAIAVGAYLALKENPSIQNTIPGVLVVDKNNRNDFYNMLDGRYKTHTAKKIQQRIEHAKKAFLNESK